MVKRTIALVIWILAICGLMATGTWAYFSDNETSTANVVSAATMDLIPTISATYSGPVSKYTVTPGGNAVNGKAVFSAISRGQTGTIKWVLTNTGSVGGTLTAASTVTFAEGSGNYEIEQFFNGIGGRPENNDGGNGDLDQYLMVTLQRGIGTDSNPSLSYILGSTGSPVLVTNLEAALDDAVGVGMEGSPNNDTVVYLLSWEMIGDDPCASVAQGDSVEIDIIFDLNE